MGATCCIGSDCYPATIIEVSESGKSVKVRRDDTKVLRRDQWNEPEYEITENPLGIESVYTLRKSGGYVLKGCSYNSGLYLGIGFRRMYYDPHI